MIVLLLLSGCSSGRGRFEGAKDVVPGQAARDPVRGDDGPGTDAFLGEAPAAGTNRNELTAEDLSLGEQDEAADHGPATGVEQEGVEGEAEGQSLFEAALEACDAAQSLWEEGRIEEALDTLDSAYAYIAMVAAGEDPELLRQKNDLRLLISRRIVEIYASRQTAASGGGRTIPLTDNRYVRAAIKGFQTRERSFFISSYQRSGRYREMIVEELRRAGLPEELSWLPLIESGFKARALSRARALGLWQFIASTGYRYGLRRDQWVDERMDPVKSTQAAIGYLTDLHGLFGDWTTALASYNCGEGNVLKAIRAQQINYLDDFWDLYQRLPRETAAYVPRFIATLKIVSDPAAYGFELPEPAPPQTYETVIVNRPVRLSAIGKRIEVPEADLKDLNPELRHSATPERSYELRVPSGAGATLAAAIEEIPRWKPAEATYVVHRVRRGQTVSGIARRYRTSVVSIARLNRLKSTHRIWPGQRLKIPVRGYSRGSSSTPPPPSVPKGKPVKYTVKRGDSLWRIANSYRVTVSEIKKTNRLKSDRLMVGQVLTLEPGLPGGAQIYRVASGDTLSEIADRHGMGLTALLRLNRLSRRSKIYPGQELWVSSK